MTISPTIESPRRSKTKRPASVIILVALLALLTIGAIQGGVAMVLDPISPLGMSVDFLENAPVNDYFWPGMFLLGIAVACLLTIPGLLFRWEWKWAAGIESAIKHKWPWLAALSIGGVLLVFEILELFMVPFHPVMHPALIVLSVAVIVLTLAASTRAYLAND